MFPYFYYLERSRSIIPELRSSLLFFFFLTLALPTLMLGLTLPIHMGFYLQQHGLGRNFVKSCPYRLKTSKPGIRFRKMSFP